MPSFRPLSAGQVSLDYMGCSMLAFFFRSIECALVKAYSMQIGAGQIREEDWDVAETVTTELAVIRPEPQNLSPRSSIRASAIGQELTAP
jgi:hypothetical protein